MIVELINCPDCQLPQLIDAEGFLEEPDDDGYCVCAFTPAPPCVNCGRTAREGFARCEPCAALRNGRNPGRRRMAKTADGLRVKTWDPERWNPQPA